MFGNLQRSRRIKDHLKELEMAYDKSKNKPLLKEFIDFWVLQYDYKKQLELSKQLN